MSGNDEHQARRAGDTMATKEELAELRTRQTLLERALSQIAESTQRFSETAERFAVLAERFERHLERSEKVHELVFRHDTDLAVIKSHGVVEKVEQHDRDLPALKEVRSWIIGGVLFIVGSVFIAAAAVIFH